MNHEAGRQLRIPAITDFCAGKIPKAECRGHQHLLLATHGHPVWWCSGSQPPLPDAPQDGDAEPQGQPMRQGGLQPPGAPRVLHHREAADEDEERAAQQLGHTGLDVALEPVRLRRPGPAVHVHHHLLLPGLAALGRGHERGWDEAGGVLVAVSATGTMEEMLQSGVLWVPQTREAQVPEGLQCKDEDPRGAPTGSPQPV